jgi:Tfp pilus assembly protein PilX
MEMKFSNQGSSGFALVAALLALMILTAMGLLVFAVSTQDIRISSRLAGEKKAFSAAETGVHRMTQSFDPTNLPGSAVSNIQVDSTNDPASRYSVGTPTLPTTGPAVIALPGYAMAGGQQWGQARYNVRVTGINQNYGSSVQVDVGAGYGPVELTTTYR